MDDIAVIGLSFRLPQEAVSEESLWEILESRRNLMTEWPEARIKSEAFYDLGLGTRNKLRSKGAHFLKQDPASFDAPFFSITANDAAAMDPQHRLALESAYHAFENAGMPVSALRGSRTSVYAASFTDDYTRMLAKDPDLYPRTTIMGTAPSILANRLSWYFDLSGPSMHVDTACSSSLVALDLACQSLKNGDAAMALVVGTNMLLSPEASVLLSNGDFLSPDGVCYSFDHRASGYARGEGIVSLLIKPVSDAVRDGDMIRAVIRAIGSNQDGRTPVISQPSAKRQEDLIRHVYHKAGLDLAPVRYVEAHGTGTRVGDPIEMEALGRVFGTHRSASAPLYVGSIKANIGHSEGSAGLAGVLKAMLVLEKAVIPPNALFERLNSSIDANLYHIAVPTRAIDWPGQGLRRVSVNSFGFGGTNSHAVLDDAFHYLQARCMNGIHHSIARPKISSNGKHSAAGSLRVAVCSSSTNGQPESGLPDNGSATNGVKISLNILDGSASTQSSIPRLLVFSAPGEKSLARVVQGYKPYYEDHIRGSASKLDQLAYTLAARRSHQLWRNYALVHPGAPDQNVDLLVSKPTRASPDCKVAFVFTGQGAQYAGMGLELLQYPVFRHTLEDIDKALGRLGCSWSVVDQLESDNTIHRPEYSQPLCTALQIALTELLKAFGVVPGAVVGHSSGEIAAAYAAGALSLASACKVAYFRGLLAGKLRDTAPPGAMLSVNLAAEKIPVYVEAIGPDLARCITVACVNSPVNSTLSGPAEAIDVIQHQLDRDGIFARTLNTGVAYHSQSMQSIANEYLEQMGQLEPPGPTPDGSTTKPTFFSTVTGQIAAPTLLAMPQYWVDNLVSPVRFSEGLLALASVGAPVVSDLVEIGPHNALRRPVQDTLMVGLGGPKDGIVYHSALSRTKNAHLTILELAGRLFCRGYPLSLAAVNQQQQLPSRIPLPFRIDCPSYPFDHSQNYWAESRLSRDFRLREPVPRSSLGARYHHWNPLDPIWRQFLCVEAIPWVKDHEITGRILYPGAGMLIMALEAVKQMCPEDRRLSGLFIKDAHFLNPIMLAETWEESTEVLIQLRPMHKAYEKQIIWYDVRITTQTEGRWAECFSASIRTEFEDEAATQVDGGTETRLTLDGFVDKARSADEVCTQPLDHRAFYRRCHEVGLSYGDSFQLLEDIRWDGEKVATARIDVTSAKHQIDSLVHPAVLDCALQLTGAQVSKGLTEPMATCVPSQLSEAWFAPHSSSWQHPQTSRLRCSMARTAIPGARGTVTTSVHVFADDYTPLCAIGRLSMTSVSADLQGHPGGGNVSETKLLHGVRWKPQLSLLSSQQLHLACQAAKSSEDDDMHMKKFRGVLDATLDDVLSNTSRTLTLADRERVPGFLVPYVSWLDHKFEQRRALLIQEHGGPGHEVYCDDTESRLETATRMCPAWEIFSSVARSLERILVGDVDPLQVAFGAGLAERFYVDLFARTCDKRFGRFLDLMAHENPCMRVLEVGAGTGSMTERVLATLGDERDGGVNFAEYTYTDLSPAFFDKARTRFGRFPGRMHFRTLDLERNALEQGFEAASYDVVFAGSVLHATADLAATLRALRALLKPAGRLVFLEIVAPESVVTNFAFGVLPGWWRCSEPWRQLCPAITEQQWDKILRQNGFSGTDLILRDHASDACHIASIMVSTVSPVVENSAEGTAPSRNLYLLVTDGLDQAGPGSLVYSIQAQLPAWNVQALRLDHVRGTTLAADDVVISLLEAGAPFLASMTDSDFQSLKDMIQRTRNLLWVAVAGMENAQYPDYSLMQGFLRSIRSENIDKRIVSLSIETGVSIHESTRHVLTVLKANFASQPPSSELEYRVSDDTISTLRAFELGPMDARVRSLSTAKPRSRAWKDVPPAKLSVGHPGFLDSLEFVQDQVYETALGHDEIEIEAKAWGLSFRDVFVGLGRLANDDDLGYDFAGVVTRIGSGHHGDVLLGDRVCGVSLGCMRAFPRAPSVTVVKIPAELSFEAAASVVAPSITAYYSLVQVGRLRKGDKVLIHSASGSTGQMAIWVAKSVGAEIFATVGFDDKKQLLMEKFHLPADHIFYSRNTSFAQGVLRVTKGYGVDVVLNSLSGDGLRASWECMAPYGRFIEIGKSDITSNSGLPMAGFARNVSFTAVDLHHVAHTNPTLVGELVRKTMELVRCQSIGCPSPVHIYSASKVEDAFRYLQSGRSTGRIVISIGSSDVVQTRMRETRHWVFDRNASYMVCGGLGGLGRAIVRWMASRGARYLIVPSRSGPAKSPAAARTVLELRQQGVEVVAPTCDVSSAADVADLLRDAASIGMPPIKGCVNAAMVLQDAVFDNMTHAQWALTLRSKAQSSWNLHRMLPADLDFFVLLSSLAGIHGSVAQSNYAAGCTFQDALARFRTARGHGLRSVALDLGWMRNIGIIAETDAYRQVREAAADMARIEETELLGLLDLCCDPSEPLTMPTPSPSAAMGNESTTQVLVGVVTPADRLVEGKAPPTLTQRPLFAAFSIVGGTKSSNNGSVATTTATTTKNHAIIFRQKMMAKEDVSGDDAIPSKTGTSPARIVVSALAEKLARVVAISADDIEPAKRLDDYGVDSLIAVELRNWLAKDFSATVAVFEIMGSTSIAAIGDLVVEKTELGQGKTKVL